VRDRDRGPGGALRTGAAGEPGSPAVAAPASPPARLTVLSGPSGVGKGTVADRLRQRCPWIWQSVSVTTRLPRPGEVNGREYIFTTDQQFQQMVAAGELLEWADNYGNCYGTQRGPVEQRMAEGKNALLELDVKGARQVRAAVPGALLVFLAPPSWDELVRRLQGRGTESAEVIDRRLEAARDELAAEPEFDITLVNTSVEDVCDQLVRLILAQQADGRGGIDCNPDPEGTRWQRVRP
jgi:guanylate kinase